MYSLNSNLSGYHLYITPIPSDFYSLSRNTLIIRILQEPLNKSSPFSRCPNLPVPLPLHQTHQHKHEYHQNTPHNRNDNLLFTQSSLHVQSILTDGLVDRGNSTLSPYGHSALPIVQQFSDLRALRSIHMAFESVFRKACRRNLFSRGVRGASNVVPKGHVVVA